MKELIDAWNSIKEDPKVRELVDSKLVGAFISIPPGIWEFTFSKEDELITVKDTDPVIINKEPGVISGEINIDEVNINLKQLLDRIDGETLKLCPGEEKSRIFIVLQNKDEQEFLATVTTNKMSVLTIRIDPITGRVKHSKKTEIFSLMK